MLNPSRIASHAAGACALALALLAPAQAAPVLQMSSASSATGIDITVSVSEVEDLSAYQFTLNFNPALLSFVSATEGAFLSSGGATNFFPGLTDTAGSIGFVFNALAGFVPGVDGSGELATFSFGIDQGGLANFSLSDVMFLDSNWADIEGVTSTDLAVQVGEVPEPGSLLLGAVGLFALLGSRAIRPRAR